jgi:patatin-like phospholipase/acyl hydrolase
MKRKVTILSIDGGGIRGIIPAVILSYIEEGLQRKAGNRKVFLSDYFDMVAGTSTGGILACFYLLPEAKPAKEAVEFYARYGKAIFSKRSFNPLGLREEKYAQKGLEEVLLKTMGEAKLSEVKKRCLITAYDMEQRKAVMFTDKDTAVGDIRNYYLRDVARATSAAPTYFEPAEVRSLGDAVSHLIDGGIFANNPTLCAGIEAHKSDFGFCKNPTADDLFILSVGTGKEKKRYKYADAKDWGLVGWARPMLDMLLSASAEVVHYQLRQLFEGGTGKYHRLEPELGNASPEMDDASEGNIKHLREAGSAYVREHVERLEEVVEFLYGNCLMQTEEGPVEKMEL